MKLKVEKDFEASFDGINAVSFVKGETVDLKESDLVNRLIISKKLSKVKEKQTKKLEPTENKSNI